MVMGIIYIELVGPFNAFSHIYMAVRANKIPIYLQFGLILRVLYLCGTFFSIGNYLIPNNGLRYEYVKDYAGGDLGLRWVCRQWHHD